MATLGTWQQSPRNKNSTNKRDKQCMGHILIHIRLTTSCERCVKLLTSYYISGRILSLLILKYNALTYCLQVVYVGETKTFFRKTRNP